MVNSSCKNNNTTRCSMSDPRSIYINVLSLTVMCSRMLWEMYKKWEEASDTSWTPPEASSFTTNTVTSVLKGAAWKVLTSICLISISFWYP